jgi:7,8-dihydropterin-6-yl-methyl-4-(beta-D-ribofuranosyl)aminobenzene 5'-phosphate synthase
VNFIGGLHLLDSDENNIFESVEEVESLAREILNRNISLYTGHCTGDKAKDILSNVLGENFKEFYSGFNMNL